jgi:hypothetical protein
VWLVDASEFVGHYRRSPSLPEFMASNEVAPEAFPS